MRPPVALTVAGSDSGGGAGIQADLATFHRFRVFGTSVITCLTAQNTRGVRGVFPVPVDFLLAQLDAVFDDIPPLAVKTGMLFSRPLIEAAAEAFGARAVERLVVDPVMVATSGDRLLEEDAVEAYRLRLIPRALLVTPNLPEAEVLSGREIRTPADMEKAAREIAALGARAVLIKGGHLSGERVLDLLWDGAAFHRYEGERVAGAREWHGSGCTLSAAIAAGLACGLDTASACESAIIYIRRAIAAAHEVGQGALVLDHWA